VTVQFKPWEKVVFAIAIVNFAVFIFIAMRIGGDALNGKVENGHYLLNSHGTYTEVSHRVFLYSQIHATTVFITHSLGFLVGYRAKRRKDAENSN
jgi:hypothetical protein